MSESLGICSGEGLLNVRMGLENVRVGSIYYPPEIVMTLTPSKLRQNIYKILDDVAEKGIPVEINRKGKIIKIVAEENHGKTKNLKRRKVMNCDPEDLVHLDWSAEWRK